MPDAPTIIAVLFLSLGGFFALVGGLGIAMDGWPWTRQGIPAALNKMDKLLLVAAAILLPIGAAAAFATV